MIELLVVIAIIGILAAVVLVNIWGSTAKARDARRIADMKHMQKALHMYYLDYGHFPHSYACPGVEPNGAWCNSAGLSSEGYWIQHNGTENFLSDYIQAGPTDPIQDSPPSSLYAPGAYFYFSNGSWYMLVFSLENPSADLEAQDGVTCGSNTYDYYSALVWGVGC